MDWLKALLALANMYGRYRTAHEGEQTERQRIASEERITSEQTQASRLSSIVGLIKDAFVALQNGETERYLGDVDLAATYAGGDAQILTEAARQAGETARSTEEISGLQTIARDMLAASERTLQSAQAFAKGQEPFVAAMAGQPYTPPTSPSATEQAAQQYPNLRGAPWAGQPGDTPARAQLRQMFNAAIAAGKGAEVSRIIAINSDEATGRIPEERLPGLIEEVKALLGTPGGAQPLGAPSGLSPAGGQPTPGAPTPGVPTPPGIPDYAALLARYQGPGRAGIPQSTGGSIAGVGELLGMLSPVLTEKEKEVAAAFQAGGPSRMAEGTVVPGGGNLASLYGGNLGMPWDVGIARARDERKKRVAKYVGTGD